MKKEKSLIVDKLSTNSSSPNKDSETETTTEFQSDNSTTMTALETTIPPDIINNVHSNNFFEKYSPLVENVNENRKITNHMPKEENTTVGNMNASTETITSITMKGIGTTEELSMNITDATRPTENTTVIDNLPVVIENEVSPNDITSEKLRNEDSTTLKTIVNQTLVSAERIDTSTEMIEATTIPMTKEDFPNSSLLNNFSDINSSTEDLLALETTTKHKVIQEKSVDLNEQPTTLHAEILDTVKSVVHFITSEEENDVSSHNNFQNNQVSSSSSTTESITNKAYEVKEASSDFTTTEKLFVSAKPITEASALEDELSVEPLTKINSFEDEHNKEISFRSIDSSESNNISDEVLSKEARERENTTEKESENIYFPIVKPSFDDIKPVTEDFEIPKFIRCHLGQFQCLNGTSINDGSYCIPNTDRCDSVFDCSDGSDEVRCEEEKCPNNYQVTQKVSPGSRILISEFFQCASGQCLKRHLVCDGIVNCNDGSDEINCGKLTR